MIVCGIDEVGRGALAGPILAVAAAFRLDELVTMQHCPIPNVDDSKSYSTAKKREAVFKHIILSHYMLNFGVGECSVEEINKRGIDWCNAVAFQRALAHLKLTPDMLYVDGDNAVMGWPGNKQVVEPKADAKYWPVSAASVLAKVIRDRQMHQLDRLCPGYAWHSNAGYGSPVHQAALKLKGPTTYHRTQFIQKLIAKKS